MNVEIGLADFIDDLRSELVTAMARGSGSKVRFSAKSIDLELQIGAEKKKDGSGKLSFRVFGIGAEGGGGSATSASSTQTLKLSLALVDEEGKEGPLIFARSGTDDL